MSVQQPNKQNKFASNSIDVVLIEEALQESEQKFRSLLDQTPIAIQIHSLEGILLKVNKAWEDLWGLSGGSVVGKFNIFQDRQSEELGITSLVMRALAGESVYLPDYELEVSPLTAAGNKRWVRSSIYPLKDATGNVMQVVITHQDITAFKLREDRYQIIVDNANEAIMIIQDGIMKFFNHKALEICGYEKAEDYAGKPFVDFIHPDYREIVVDRHYRRMKGENVPNFYQIQVIHKNGSYVWLQVNAIRFDWEGRPASLAFIFDITEQKRTEKELKNYRLQLEDLVEARTKELEDANKELQKEIADRQQIEKALRKSEERYKDLFENATDLIQVTGIDGGILFVNRAWRNAMGYSAQKASSLSFRDIVHPDFYERWQNTLNYLVSEKKIDHLETVLITSSGKELEVEGTANCNLEDGKAVSAQIIVRDVTDKRKIEKELFRNQKLESLGLLAGGIAHDFNNLLTVILGNVTMAKKQMNPDEKNYARLAQTEKATLRAKALTQQLLTFSKGGAPIKETTTITELIKDSCTFTLRGSNVKCEYSFPKNLWPVDVDRGQLSQVIQNLIINAKQVMPDGGKVDIRAKNRTIPAGNLLSLKEGKYINLAFKDYGTGIPKKHISKIFDPYFTTKAQGSGLGLAIAYSIIKKHEGSISAESKVGEGSTFSVYLPASESHPDPYQEKEERLFRGIGRILVMDDDEILRGVAAEMLTQNGYQVELARDGNEAINLYEKAQQEGHPFAAVILDLTIPGGLGGIETLKKLLAIDPDAKAILSSGYVTDEAMTNFKEYGFAHSLPKPYESEELCKMLHAVLKG